MAGISKYPYVKIYLQTFGDTMSDEFGREMFNIIWEEDALLAPQRFGVLPRKQTEYTNIDDLMSYWPHHIESWRRNKKLKNYGQLGHSRQVEVGLMPGSLMFTSKYSPSINWETKFYQLCELFRPRVGMMHLYTEFECQKENSTSDFRSGVFGRWHPKVTGLGWMFAAGERFYKPTKEINLDGTGVERKDFGDYVTIKTAKSETEIIENYHDFHQRRANIIHRFPQKYYPKFHRLTNPQALKTSQSGKIK